MYKIYKIRQSCVEEHARRHNVRAPQILEFLRTFDVNVDVDATMLVQDEIFTRGTNVHEL